MSEYDVPSWRSGPLTALLYDLAGAPQAGAHLKRDKGLWLVKREVAVPGLDLSSVSWHGSLSNVLLKRMHAFGEVAAAEADAEVVVRNRRWMLVHSRR